MLDGFSGNKRQSQKDTDSTPCDNYSAFIKGTYLKMKVMPMTIGKERERPEPLMT